MGLCFGVYGDVLFVLWGGRGCGGGRKFGPRLWVGGRGGEGGGGVVGGGVEGGAGGLE